MPLFQNEYTCETIHMEMSSERWFIFMQISHFNKKGFALRLVLKQRHKGTRILTDVARRRALLHCRIVFPFLAVLLKFYSSSCFNYQPVTVLALVLTDFQKDKRGSTDQLKKPWILMLNRKKTCACTLSTSTTLFAEMVCCRYRSVGRLCF